jgi:two-component system OmpR family sensor kinase
MSSMTLRIGIVAAVTLAALQFALGWAGYAYATRRIDGLLDGELRIQAAALRDVSRSIDPATETLPGKSPRVVEMDADSRGAAGFQYWGDENRLFASSRNLQNVALDAWPLGFANVSIGGKSWRVLTEFDGGHWIRVVQRGDVRRAIERSAAVWMILLIGIGTPIVVASMIWILGRGLAPIPSFAEQIGRCIPGRGGPIGLGELPTEFEPIVASVNGLLARCKVAAKACP